jgi:molybdopterin synthase catalytic subunit
MDRVKQMSMSRVNGALVFFSTIVKESVLDGVESLVEEMKKEMMTEELPSSV